MNEVSVTALSPMRKVIAARMAEAKQTIPHFRLTTEIEVDALLDMRKALRECHDDVNISLNDLLIKACANALSDTAINIQWVEGEIHQYHTADISVVIALEDGLSTPIIRNADTKTVCEISREIRELAFRAAKRSLKMHEIFGGTFSVSNLGMFGVDQFDAIINPPQCAILAIDAAKPRVVVSSDGQTRVATVMRVTLSIDHRVLDGAIGAAFPSAFLHRVEQPRDWVRS